MGLTAANAMCDCDFVTQLINFLKVASAFIVVIVGYNLVIGRELKLICLFSMKPDFKEMTKTEQEMNI